jgi:hypothetical protein
MPEKRRRKRNRQKQPTKPQSKSVLSRSEPNSQMSVSYAPLAMTTKIAATDPICSSFKGGMRIERTEFLGPMFGTVAFSAIMHGVNPGNPQSFRWLSTIAQAFETYELDELEFIYKPTCPATTPGMVCFAVDYDASDPLPSSVEEILQNETQLCVPSWQPGIMKCNLRALNSLGPRRYLRSGNVTGDIKTFDVGNYVNATEGQADASVIGFVYMRYKVKLFTPQGLVAPGINYCSKIVAGGTISNNNPMGTIPIHSGVLPVIISNPANTVTRLRIGIPGQWIVIINTTGTGQTGATYAAISASSSVTTGSGVINGGTTLHMASFFLKTLAINAGVDITYGSTTITANHLRIAPWPYDLL